MKALFVLFLSIGILSIRLKKGGAKKTSPFRRRRSRACANGCDQTIVSDAITQLTASIAAAQKALQDLHKLQGSASLWDTEDNIPGLVISEGGEKAERDYNHPEYKFMTCHSLPEMSGPGTYTMKLVFNGTLHNSYVGIIPPDTDFKITSGIVGDSENTFALDLVNSQKYSNGAWTDYCNEHQITKQGDTLEMQVVIDEDSTGSIKYIVNDYDCGIAFKNVKAPQVFAIDIYREGFQSFEIIS